MIEPVPPSELSAPEQPAPETIPGVSEPRLPLELRDTIGVQPDEPLAEAGRRILRYHFERMLLHEPGTREGTDIEALHDMRVATRRMRSAFRMLKPAYLPGAIKFFRKELRRLGGTLGAVRDLDVALDRLARYADAHPEADVSPLLIRWNGLLADARADLIAELDSARFATFVARFDAFLREPGAGAKPAPSPEAPAPYLVRHAVPPLIVDSFARVRAYEPVIPGAPVVTLHALRIDLKRLRYALEFFREVLGPEAGRVISVIKRLQDHLGDLHDADVAVSELSMLLDLHEAAYSGTPSYGRPNLDGVYDYLAAQIRERQRLVDTFPEAWAAFTAEDLRRDLALAVAVL